MIQLICLGWIIGIATMGQDIPLLHCLLIPSMCFFSLCLLAKLTIFKTISALWLKAGLLGISFFLALLLGSYYAQQHLNQRLHLREHHSAQLELIVYIKHINEQHEHVLQQKIQVLNRHVQPVQWQASVKIEQPATQKLALQLGHYYRLQGTIRPAHGYATPGVFDQEQWFIQQNIMSGFKVLAIQELTEQQINALGYATYVKRQHTWTNQVRLWIEQQRLALRDFIHQQPVQHKGLLLALLTGDKSLLDRQTEQLFQRFGMSHLLAISGPHVLIFAILFCAALHQLIRRYAIQIYLIWPKQYFFILPFCSCVLLYCAFVGFEIPALRTLLSCMVVSAFLLLKQKIQPLTILLLSAAILLIFDPFSVLSAAFWLSYVACFVLLRIYQTMQQQHSATPIKSNWQLFKMQLKLLVESQWKIFLALFPLMIIFFKQLAWISPLSNILALPWIGLVVVPLDIIAACCYFIFQPLAALIFQINDVCLSLLLLLLNGLDGIFSARLQPVAMNFWLLLSVCLGLIIVFLPRGVLPKAWSLLCFMPLALNDRYPYDFELSILDVGQGQAIFVRDHTQSLMVDTGGNYDESKFSVGKQIILPFLSVNGVSALNKLILTHLDQDHRGGYESIKQDFPIEQIYSNEAVTVAQASQFNYCIQGQQWQWSDQVQITILSPQKQHLVDAVHEKNEQSCVIYLQVKNAKPYQNFLLMGDAGWPTEYQILQDYPDLKVDVLVLGHHGSRHSSAYAFLKQLNPKLAVASAGVNNRYGHPSVQVTARLKELNIPLLSTIQHGTIRFSKQKNTMALELQRNTRQWLTR